MSLSGVSAVRWASRGLLAALTLCLLCVHGSDAAAQTGGLDHSPAEIVKKYFALAFGDIFTTGALLTVSGGSGAGGGRSSVGRSAGRSVASGTADFAAGDGVVGSYMLRDFPTLRFNGQIAPAVPVGVAVGKDKPELEQAVRKALDDLSAQGVLETLRRKWMGDQPRLVGATDASGTVEATATP